ncbi:MAG: SDR family NAD(P)-dependent oxidoreductase [Chromatiales bacterium]|nr:SDR family NAD(P)-dependent oxidoreductase [Chromatiales bacterium]
MQDKVVVITGAARGFGRAIAERMGRDGCRVVAWDVAPDADQPAAHVERVDVGDPESVAAATRNTLAAVGRIDVLVNNAGVNGPTVPIWDYPLEDWRRVIAVDLTGVFLCCRSVVPHMRERGEGRIVNIASVAGKEGNANAGPYSAAKAGVIALTKSLGKELARSGVLVNCITPAMADTELLHEMTPEYIEGIRAKIPMGRLCRVEEVAEMVLFLSGPGCTFTTGGVFDLTGGRSVY